jgi:hypothetical protein
MHLFRSSRDFKELFEWSYYTIRKSGNYVVSHSNPIQLRKLGIDDGWCSVSPCDGNDGQCQGSCIIHTECSDRSEHGENHNAKHKENIEAREHINKDSPATKLE